jgi:hypothetical protein
MQSNHSVIKEYPINTEKFPLVKKVTFHEYILTENQYLFVPKLWYHWIFTDPYTLSYHYWCNEKKPSIPDIDYTDLFYDHVCKKEPFTGEGMYTNHFSIQDFMKENETHRVNVFYSTEDFAPVLKEGQSNDMKFFRTKTIKDVTENKENVPMYCMYNKFSDMTIYKDEHINNIINSDINLSYLPTVWFTLNNSTDSGLHCDPGHSIIYVRSGKKRVLLANPKDRPYLYISSMPSIKNDIKL